MTIPNPKASVFSSSFALKGLSRYQLARLQAQLEPCSYHEGDLIQQAGEPTQAFYYFKSDSPGLKFDPPGNPDTTYHECGEECLAGFKRSLFTVIATGETHGWRVTAQIAREISKEVPEIKTQTMNILADRLHNVMEVRDTSLKPSSARKQLSWFHVFGWWVAILVPCFLGLWLHWSGSGTTTATFMAIMLVVVILWLFSLVELFLPPIIGIAAAIFTGLVPAETALSGFSSSSFLELLCVLVVSSVLMTSGLSFRLLLAFIKVLPKRLNWQLQIPLILGFFVSPVIPSNNSRMALLIPIMQEIGGLTRLVKNPIAATSILTCGYSASVIFSNMLPSSKATNIALVGLLPRGVQAEFNGLFWFESALIVTIGMLVAHLFLTHFFFRTEESNAVSADVVQEGLTILGPLSFEEYVAGFSILALVVGMITYPYHHVSMSSISGLILFSLLSLGLMTKSGFKKDIDWALIFFLIGSQCMIKIAENLGVDAYILDSLSGISGWIEGNPWRLVTAIIAVILPIRFMLPGPPSALLVTTIFNPIALDNHLSPWVSLFVCGFLSDIWFLPYQSGSWSQTQSTYLFKVMVTSKFNAYNMAMNVIRIGCAYLCIPYWQWLAVL